MSFIDDDDYYERERRRQAAEDAEIEAFRRNPPDAMTILDTSTGKVQRFTVPKRGRRR